MSTPVISLPSRPLRVHPPGTGFGSNFWTLAWCLARTELGRRGVILASAVRVLAVSAPVEDPLHVPALVLLALCGAVATGLVGGAGSITVKVRRMDAIFR